MIFLKFIYWIFGVKLRKIYSPMIYWTIRTLFYFKKLPDVWKDYKTLSMDNFERVLKLYPYKPDFIGGILDCTLEEPDFFFVSDRKYFRDCLPQYETVFTPEGKKEIKYLKIGDLILSYNWQLQKLEYKPIVNIWETGEKEVFRLFFKNGLYSDSSKEHKFFKRHSARNSIYSEVSVEDIIKLKNHKKLFYKNKFPCIKELPFEINDVEWLNEDLCFIVGYFFAEGWVENKINKSTGHISQIVKVGGHDIPKHIIEKLEINNIPYNLMFRKTDNLPHLTFLKSDFKDFLGKLKISSFKMNIPKELLNLPKNKLQQILNGHMLGDGHIRKKRQHEKTYSTSCNELKDFICEISLKLNNPLYLYFQENHQGVGNQPIWRIIDNDNSFFKRDYGWNQLSETSIKKIESLDKKEKMYDLEVEDNHNFILASSNTIVHNCDDYAKLWFLWATENQYSAWLMIVVDGWKFWKSHKYVLIKNKNPHSDILLVTPYTVMKGHPDIQTAMNQFKLKELLRSGKYKNAIHLIYDKNFEELEI